MDFADIEAARKKKRVDPNAWASSALFIFCAISGFILFFKVPVRLQSIVTAKLRNRAIRREEQRRKAAFEASSTEIDVTKDQNVEDEGKNDEEKPLLSSEAQKTQPASSKSVTCGRKFVKKYLSAQFIFLYLHIISAVLSIYVGCRHAIVYHCDNMIKRKGSIFFFQNSGWEIVLFIGLTSLTGIPYMFMRFMIKSSVQRFKNSAKAASIDAAQKKKRVKCIFLGYKWGFFCVHFSLVLITLLMLLAWHLVQYKAYTKKR